MKNQTAQYAKNKAFTLAEVLITLGIIGVVAAMTLPSLLNNQKNKALEAGLKKNASAIAQALLAIQATEGEPPTQLNSTARSLKPQLVAHMKVLRDCGWGTEISACVFNNVFNPDLIKTHAYRTFNNESETASTFFDDGQFILTDGSMILLENNTGKGVMFISVDVNGYNKNPNQWGHDLFTFQVMDNGKFLPMGAEGTEYADDSLYCSRTSTSIFNGIGCTYKAMIEQDYFKNLP